MKTLRQQCNEKALKDLLKMNKKGDLRFFQMVSNYFGLQYIGYADDPEGTNFKDLFHKELKIELEDE